MGELFVYLIGSAILGLLIIPKGLEYLQSSHYSLLIARATIGWMASFLYTISINYIPIVNGTLLFNTAPIFIPILVVLFLKGKIAKNIWWAVAVGFIGIIVIIKPTAQIFTQMGNLIGLASGICLAIAYLIMKILTNTDPGLRIIFYYLGIGTLIQIPMLFFAGPFLDLNSLYYSLSAGILLLIAQLSLIKAYRYAEASEVGIYQYTSVVYVGLFGWLLWGTIPSKWDLLGAILVASAGVIIIHSNHNNAKS